MNSEIKRYFIDEVSDLTSVNFAQKLVDNFKGQRIYIPTKTPHEKHFLSKVFNEQEIDVLIENFGGNHIDVPMRLVNEAPFRKAKILELKSKNYGVQEIAGEVNCTWRWVQKILSNHKKKQEINKDQGSLF
ncbi:MAG: hypothetical protein ACK5N8_02155 [Alphaproteobacteria bacterium]